MNNKINKVSLIIEVLSRLSYKELLCFKRKIPSVFHSLLKVPYLRRKNFDDIFRTGKILYKNPVDLYGTLAFIIQNNDNIINHYVRLKEQLDYETLIGNYNNAYKLLEQIEQDVSVSMTGTYYKLKLTQLDKGITASTELYNIIYKANESIRYISNVALKSASIDMPFEAEIENMYQSLHDDDVIKDFITAFAFPFKDLRGDTWLRLLTCTSIIDLYEGFILHLSKQTPDRLKDEHVGNVIGALSMCIHDVRIMRYNELINNVEYATTEEYAIGKTLIEKYYKDDYEFVFNKGLDYIKTYPRQSTIFDIVNRSCVKLGRVQNNVFPEDSLAGRIYNFSMLASKNDNSSEIFKAQLKNLCMAWYAMPSMRYFYTLYEDIDNSKNSALYQRFWRYSLIPEIRDTCFFNNNLDAISYLEKTGYQHDTSSQIAILEDRKIDKYNQTKILLKGIDEKDIQLLQEAIENSELSPILISRVVSQVFACLMECGRYDEAIHFIVKIRLLYPEVRIYIDRQRIGQIMTDVEDSKIKNQMELSIFYTMINSDVYKRYLAYKRYLKIRGLGKASEIDDINDLSHQFFIGKVADRSVLSLHVRQFDTEDSVDVERIELCKKMAAIRNDKIYTDEITSLIKEHEVRALAQQVNDSKIHVDIESLVNNEFASERLMFDTYKEVDNNLVMFEQKNLNGLIDYLQKQYEGKSVLLQYELPAVKYKKVLFRQIVLSVRDKFLFDPRYGLDKYLSARVRHGTLITQLRNHFLISALVTNKQEGGEYIRTNLWTQHKEAVFSNATKEKINARLLLFTEWLDEQLREVKEEKIQIQTERNPNKKDGLFNYSEELMADEIDVLEENIFESFDAFIYAVIGLLWKWTNNVLQDIRNYFQEYKNEVLAAMLDLQNDIVPMMSRHTKLANEFKDTITSCRTDFQTDITIVTNWFKPEQSKVRYFTIQQAVDTSLSVINRVNQNKLSFKETNINDSKYYKGEYFNAFHDVFHDMMNNILGYEVKQPQLRGMSQIYIENKNDVLFIKVSNPVKKMDLLEIQKIIQQQNFPVLIAGGKTRREKNSGCVKIYSTVMYILNGISYENNIEDNYFVAKIQINTKLLEYYEDSIS